MKPLLLVYVSALGSFMSIEMIELVLSVITSFIASSGFWVYITKKNEKVEDRDKLLLAMAQDRIYWIGMTYVQRGWITQDEYSNIEALYKPYVKMGGNGSARRIMIEIDKLQIRRDFPKKEESNAQQQSV